MNTIWVMLGGAIGAGLRYQVYNLARPFSVMPFFTGTLIVNILGSFLIGVVYAQIAARPTLGDYAPFLMVGVLGGFTTFSAFSLELMKLIDGGQIAVALAYMIGSVTISLIAVYLGVWVVK